MPGLSQADTLPSWSLAFPGVQTCIRLFTSRVNKTEAASKVRMRQPFLRCSVSLAFPGIQACIRLFTNRGNKTETLQFVEMRRSFAGSARLQPGSWDAEQAHNVTDDNLEPGVSGFFAYQRNGPPFQVALLPFQCPSRTGICSSITFTRQAFSALDDDVTARVELYETLDFRFGDVGGRNFKFFEVLQVHNGGK